MDVSDTYLPHAIFAPTDASRTAPRVFISPQRYVQGPHALQEASRYLSLVATKRVAVLVSERGRSADGAVLLASLEAAGIEAVVRIFGGECSLEEIVEHEGALLGAGVEALIGLGGGKCIDTAKAVAHRLAVPVVIFPTLASNDAPCSALSVLYSPEGVSTGIEFYPQSPALVVVDTAIVAAASERYLVAGMGDAMATFYEARVCLKNAEATTCVGARPTLASYAIGEVCAQTLLAEGGAAAAAVRASKIDDALEKIVEANTLLSGLGFESGGLAVAHAVAQSYTALGSVHANYLHGEMVAMGTLAQLTMEGHKDEVARVGEFFARVGLPIHLGQLGLSPADEDALDTIVKGTLEVPYVSNMPGSMDAARVRASILDADGAGRSIAGRVGDEAYRRLHGTSEGPA